jgi:hypothetical protein
MVTAIALVLAGQAALDRQEVAGFVDTLRAAIAKGDRAAVAARVRYPITVFASGIRIPVRDAATLVQSYDVVFAPALKAAIAQATPVIGSEAATVGSAIEIRRVAGELKITRIEVPMAAAASAPAAASKGSAPREPDRLGITVGRAQRAGALSARGRDPYVIFAEKNRVLDVRVDGVRGQDIVLQIVNATSGAPIDSRIGSGVRTWAGRAPAEGDYRIEVLRRAPGSDRMPYTLTVELR